MKLRGKCALVTGAGTGIGRAIALLLAEEGMQVVLSGRRSGPLEEVASVIADLGGEALSAPADLRQPSEVERVVQLAGERFGKLDCLVNNAGVATAKSIVELTPEEWDAVLDTNLRAVFLCCRAALPGMLARKRGIVLNVGSTLSSQTLPNYSAYCASKHGLMGLTGSLAAEVEGRGVEVWSVCPGATDTPLHQGLVGQAEAAGAMRPEHVARIVLEVMTGERCLPHGGTIVVDDPPPPRPKRPRRSKRILRRIRALAGLDSAGD